MHYVRPIYTTYGMDVGALTFYITLLIDVSFDVCHFSVI